MIEDEKLKEYREQLKKISPWPYQALCVRENPLRVDIISGPPIDLEEAKKIHDERSKAVSPQNRPQVFYLNHAMQKDIHKHVVHIHAVHPAWFEQNHNYLEDANFFQKSPEIINDLLNEIERLKKEINK